MALPDHIQLNTQRGQVEPRLFNEQCNTQAERCKSEGNFFDAMRWFNSARAKTIGHKKADRYELAGQWCADQGGFKFERSNYAEDHEAK